MHVLPYARVYVRVCLHVCVCVCVCVVLPDSVALAKILQDFLRQVNFLFVIQLLTRNERGQAQNKQTNTRLETQALRSEKMIT